MPELTVSLPTYNAARYVSHTITSILAQDDVDLELIVIDDGSTDETTMIVQSFRDSRIKLIRNEKRRGVVYCHNLVVEQSRSPFIAHVDAVDVILPGAFKKILQVCKNVPHAGLAHCYSLEIDEEGKTTKDAVHRRRDYLQRQLGPELNYKRQLLRSEYLVDGFRVYKRDALQEVGKFDEALKGRAQYDMALRIVDRYEIVHVPEFLHCRRRLAAPNKSKKSRVQNLLEWSRKYAYFRHLRKSNKVRFLHDKEYGLNRLLFKNFFVSLNLPKFGSVVAHIKKPLQKFCKTFWPRVVEGIYYSVIIHLVWWPIGLFHIRHEKRSIRDKKIAYYNWHFPVLSQTFIHRELAALRKSGLNIEIIADEAEDIELADENAKSLLDRASYLDPVDEGQMQRYRKIFFLRRPLACLNLFFFTMTRKYAIFKNLDEDRKVFSKALYLAGVLRDKQVGHIHSPWADRSAFIALLAARLLKIPYSVQARAHDIHRKTYLFALQEKFENAEFVVTNTRYNQSYIKDLVKEDHWSKVVLIYNGVDLERFVSVTATKVQATAVHLLCVARLIEQKGLVYLLKACKILLESGHQLTCEIIGASEEPLYTNYFIALKKLYRQMRLEECVTFSNAQPFAEVLTKYHSADIFVLPCVIAADGSRDVTPNALIEAMAMKLPVIATTVTGIPEIVENGVSGLLIPPHDEQALANAILKLIQDVTLREWLGENARKRVEEKFDIKKNVTQYVTLFTRDCEQRERADDRSMLSL